MGGLASVIGYEGGRLTLFPASERRIVRWTETGNTRRLMLALCNKDLDVDLRGMAAAGLGRLRVKPAVPALVDLLQNGPTHLRKMCATALGQIGDPEAVEALLAACQAPEFIVRKRAILALGTFVEDKNRGLLEPFLEDEDPLVREVALTAVSRSRLSDRIALLVEALHDPAHSVRAVAARRLGVLRDPQAVPALLFGYQVGGWKNPEVLYALSKFTDEELGDHLPAVRQLLRQESSRKAET